jgi:CheY-like chemotaxis protein
MRVLYVEDSEMNRRIVREMLVAGGVEMDEAEDGQVGLERIAANDYDLILMDLRMPQMDGLTALKALRAQEGPKASLPVIVVTADAGATIHADCLAAGADEVLAKPVAMPELYDAMGRALAGGDESRMMLA